MANFTMQPHPGLPAADIGEQTPGRTLVAEQMLRSKTLPVCGELLKSPVDRLKG